MASRAIIKIVHAPRLFEKSLQSSLVLLVSLYFCSKQHHLHSNCYLLILQYDRSDPPPANHVELAFFDELLAWIKSWNATEGLAQLQDAMSVAGQPSLLRRAA